jgi:hypothetical protein
LRTNFPVLDDAPLEPLHVEADSAERGENDDGLDTSLLPLVVFGLGSPGKELDNVLGHLRGGSGGSILVFYNTVEKNTGHRDSSTGEVRVVVHALTNFDTSRRVNVTRQKREDVVLLREELVYTRYTASSPKVETYSTAVTSLDNQREIGGKSTAVARTSSLFVGVRSGHVVGKLSGSLEHLAFRVGTVGVLDLFGHGACLVNGVGDTDQVTPGNTVERVAGGANFTIDLISSSDAIPG